MSWGLSRNKDTLTTITQKVAREMGEVLEKGNHTNIFRGSTEW